jgi:hemerythrin
MIWRESLAIGIPQIDTQHKELCNKIDELYAACSQGKGANEVLNTVNYLETYTLKHFADEEILQLKIKYPKYAQHKTMHTDFAKQIAKLKSDAAATGFTTPVVINIINTISAWLLNHIMIVDKELQQYVK